MKRRVSDNAMPQRASASWKEAQEQPLKMALELRTEYPLDYKAATGAPVIAQESSDFMRFFPRGENEVRW